MPVTSSGDTLSGNSRYIRYQATLTSSYPDKTAALNDVTITYAVGSDTTLPTVTGRSPVPDSTDVSVSSNIAVTFSEPMDGTTITTGSIRLRRSVMVATCLPR